MKWPKLPIRPNVDIQSQSTLAQVLSLTTIYIFTTKTGIDAMTPTVIIGALTDKRNADNSLLFHVSEEQTSWIGSLVYLFPPVGSAIASVAQDRFGHRACMVFSNASHLVSVVTLVLAESPTGLYASSALMGFNVGFVTSFTISYCGEVCEPRLRGTLTSVTNLFYFTGYLCVTALYAATANWKLSVVLTVVLPLVNAAALFKTSHSPMWLLSKGRTEEAKQTFRKLRGNASEEKCAAEFQDMVHYTSEINLNNNATEGSRKKSTFKDSLYCLVEPETLKPLRLLMIFIFFSNVLSGIPYTPYLITIFKTFEAPFQPAWATTLFMAFGVAGNVLTICYINRLGKRFLVLGTMTISSICYLSIGFIGHFLPSSSVSSWMKIVLFFMSTFFSSMGFTPIMWTLMSEIFPMKSKNIGAGVSSATYFILCFLMTKFYLNFEAITGFYNTFFIFGGMGLIGFVYLYFQLPETENKTLNEISEHFKSKKTKTEIRAK